MKNITLFFFFSIFVCWSQWGQIPIGSQDGTTSSIPIYGLYEYSYSQQIVYQDEIRAQGDITSVSFYYGSGTTSNNTEWTIYLGHTTKESFSNNDDWISGTNLTEVFSGTVAFPGNGNFMEIIFDTPFDYNNSDNLVIAITETEPGWGGSINFGKTATIPDSKRSIFFRNDNVIPDPQNPPTANGILDYFNTMILGGIQPLCPAPSNVRVASVSSSEVEVEWTENGTASLWNIEYGETGFERGSGTIQNGITTTSVSIPITPGIDYDFYVQADCGGSDTSTWVSFTFTTSYCSASSTSTSDYLSSISSSGAVTDISYSTSSFPTGGYSDQTVLDFKAYETLTFDMSTSYVGGANGVNVWVDWNQNMTFEENEKVASVSNGNAQKTFSITVPAGIQQGTYRMRVRGQYGSSANPDSCGSITYGSAVDFSLSIIEPPTCLAPNELYVTNVTGSTLDLGWVENGTATEWEIEYGAHGFTQGSGTMVSEVATNPFTLPIEGGTEYDFYVRSVCDANDVSFWSSAYEYRYCGVSTQNGEYLSYIASDGAVTDIEYTASSQPPGSYANESGQILRTFEGHDFDLLTTYSYNGDNGVNVWVDWDRDMNFDASEMIASQRNSSPDKVIPITIPSNIPEGEYRMRVRGQWNASPPPCGEVNYGSTVDFTLYIGTPPTCPGPTNLIVESVTSNSADVSWTENGSASEWEVIYGESGFNPETDGETVSATGLPEITLVDLDSNTGYDFYVKAICGSGDESYLSRKQSFRTDCVPATIPFIEGFENGYANGADLDGCWTQTSVNGSQNWTTNTSETTYNRSPRTGNWNVYLRYSNEDWMFYPVELEAGTSYELEFYARQDASSGATIKAAFGNQNTPAAMTTTIIETRNVTSGSYQRFAGYFRPSTSGVYYIGILGSLNGTPWYLSVDDIGVNEAVGCLPPSNLAISNITETTASLTWQSLNDESEWEVIYGPAGFDPATSGTTIPVQDIPEALLTDLETDTSYDVYVRAICGPGDESPLSEVKTFFTGFCSFSSSSTDYYITDFFTEQAVVNINNRGSGRSSGGYGNFTHMELVSYPSGDFDFEAEFNGSGTYGFNMWIDFNGDLDFDESEKIYASGGYVARAEGHVVIPSNIQPGTYRMRIVADWLSGNPDPCGSRNSAEAEDYTVVIIDTPTCFPPTDVTLDMITTSSADISWIPQNNETSWKVIYGENGFNPATGGTTIEVENTPAVIIEGLEENTYYDVYIIAICDVDDESYRAGPLSFWTVCQSAGIPYIMDFETAAVPELPNCTDRENLGNGNTWETLDYNSNGFSGKVLVYRNTSAPANAWFYTQGIELEAGVEYYISYKYGNVSSAFTEKMKVAYGKSPNATQMTTELADHSSINQGAVQEENLSFTVAENGIYYFGFNVYSAANQYNLYVDDIIVDSVLRTSEIKEMDITYYPNPVDNQLTISANQSIRDLSIINLMGQLVYETKVNDFTAQVDVSRLASGTYIVKATTENGNHTFKIVKQ